MAEIVMFSGRNNASDGLMSEVHELGHMIFADEDKTKNCLILFSNHAYPLKRIYLTIMTISVVCWQISSLLLDRFSSKDKHGLRRESGNSSSYLHQPRSYGPVLGPQTCGPGNITISAIVFLYIQPRKNW